MADVRDYNYDPTPPSETPEPVRRSWGRAAIDTLLTAGEFVPQAAKAVTTLGRAAFPDPHGIAAEADRIAGAALEKYQGAVSPRGRQIASESYMPGVDEPSAYGDLWAKGGETLASALPFMLGGFAVKGGPAALRILGKVMDVGGIPIMGLQSLGQYGQSVRSTFDDDAKFTELRKDPVIEQQYQDALKQTGGDDLNAREILFNKAWDTGSAVANTVAGMAGGAALGRKLGLGQIPSRALRTGAYGVESAAIGAGMGGAGAYGQEKMDVNLGRKAAIDLSNVERGMAAGAVPMAVMGVGLGAVSPRERGGKAAEIRPPDRPDDAAVELALHHELPGGVERVTPPPRPPPTEVTGDEGFRARMRPEMTEPGQGAGGTRVLFGATPTPMGEELEYAPWRTRFGAEMPTEAPPPPPAPAAPYNLDVGPLQQQALARRQAEGFARMRGEPGGGFAPPELAEYAVTLAPRERYAPPPLEPGRGPTAGGPPIPGQRPLPLDRPGYLHPMEPYRPGGEPAFPYEPPPPEVPPTPRGGPPRGGGGVLPPPEGGRPAGGGGAAPVTPELRSALVAFPDARVTEEGAIPLNIFSSAEERALRERGLVETFRTAKGARYEGVHVDRLWELRKEAQAQDALARRQAAAERQRQTALAMETAGPRAAPGARRISAVAMERARRLAEQREATEEMSQRLRETQRTGFQEPMGPELQRGYTPAIEYREPRRAEIARTGRIQQRLYGRRGLGQEGMERQRLAEEAVQRRLRQEAQEAQEKPPRPPQAVRGRKSVATVIEEGKPQREVKSAETSAQLGADIIRGLKETGQLGILRIPKGFAGSKEGEPAVYDEMAGTRKQEMTTARRERSKVHRDEITGKALNEIMRPEDPEKAEQIRKDLDIVARKQFVGSRPQAPAHGRGRLRAGKITGQLDPLYARRPENFIPVARRVAAVLDEAIANVQKAYKDAAKIHGGATDVYKLPKKSRTRSSGKEELPEYARVARLLYHQSRIRDLLDAYDAEAKPFTTATTETRRVERAPLTEDEQKELDYIRSMFPGGRGDMDSKMRSRYDELTGTVPAGVSPELGRRIGPEALERLNRRRRNRRTGDTVADLREKMREMTRDFYVEAEDIAEETMSKSKQMTADKRAKLAVTEAQKAALEGEITEAQYARLERSIEAEREAARIAEEKVAREEAAERGEVTPEAEREARKKEVIEEEERLGRFVTRRQRVERKLDAVVDMLKEAGIKTRNDLFKLGAVGPKLIAAKSLERKYLREIEDIDREIAADRRSGGRAADTTQLIGQERAVTARPPWEVIPGPVETKINLSRARALREIVPEYERGQAVRHRFPADSLIRLRQVDAIDWPTARDLYRRDADDIEWRTAIQRHLSRELAGLLRSMAKQVPSRRAGLIDRANYLELGMDRAVDLPGGGKLYGTGAGWHEATQDIMNYVSDPKAFDKLNEHLQTKLAGWMLKRVVAENHLEAAQRRSRFAGTEEFEGLQPLPRPPLREFTAEELAKRQAPQPIEYEPAEVAPAPLTDTTKAIADWVLTSEAPERTDRAGWDRFVRTMRTDEWLEKRHRDIGDKNDPFDNHLMHMSGQVVSHVPIHEVHPDVMSELMRRTGGEPGARGGYDWKTDQIYIRNDLGPHERAATVREELGHALTMGALESERPSYGGAAGILARRMHERAGGTTLDKLNRIADYILSHDNDWKNAVLRPTSRPGERIVSTPEYEQFRNRLRNGHELVSGIWADDGFRRLLAGLSIGPKLRERLGLPEVPKNMLAAITDYLKTAVQRLFNRHSKDNMLNEVLVLSMDVMGRAIRERPGYIEGRPRVAESLGDMIRETGGKAGEAVRYHLRHGGRDIMNSKMMLKFLDTNRLVKLVSPDVRRYYENLMTVLERAGGKVHKLIDEMGVYGEGRKLKDFERLYGDKAREAFGFMNDVTIHGADPRYAIDHPANAHIKADSDKFIQEIALHPEMMAKYAELARDLPGQPADAKGKGFVPGFADIFKSQLDWHKIERMKNLRAQVFNAVDRHDWVQNEDGTRNNTARDALTKMVMDEKDSLSPAEQAWVDSKDKTAMKHHVALFHKEIPDFKNLKGPYFPLKRFGNHVAYGEFKFLPTSKGKEVEDQPGLFQFKNRDDRKEYVIKHTKEGSGTKALSIYDRVVDKNGKIADVAPRDFRKDPSAYPDLDMNYFVRFQKKYFATFESAREAQEHIDELQRSNSHLTMHPEPEHVRDFSTVRDPDYIDQSIQASINRFRRSDAFAKMPEAQRREVLAEMYNNAAKQVQLAGGRTPGLTRQYVKGASTDYFQTFMTSAHSYAYTRARAELGDQMRDAVQKIREENFKRRYDKGQGRRETYLDEMIRRAYEQHDPMSHTWLDKNMSRLTNLAYQADLSGPGFMMINSMEPTMQSLPNLQAKVGRIKGLAVHMGAYRDLGMLTFIKRGFNDFWNAFRGKLDDVDPYDNTIHSLLEKAKVKDLENEKKLFTDLANDNFFDPESINRVSVLRSFDENAFDRALEYGKRMFQGFNNSIEVMNRAQIALSHFRAAEGKPYEEKLRDAKDAISRFAGNYTQWASAPITNLRGLAMPLMQYKKFALRVMSEWVYNAAGSLARIDPELRKPGREADLKLALAERSERRKQFVNMLAMQSMVAGLFGLPTEVFSVPVNAAWIAGVTDQNWDDILDSTYKAGAEEFGPDVMQALAHGLVQYTGGDVYDRQSLANLIFFGVPASTKPSDIAASVGGFAMGSAGQHLLKFGRGIGEFSDAIKDYAVGAEDRGSMKLVQAARDLMPIRWGSDIASAVLNSVDETAPRTVGGALIGPEWNGYQTFLQSMGIVPTDVARAREMRRAEKRYTTRITEERQMWIQRFAMEKDLGNRVDIENGIREFNDTHSPADRIRREDLMAAVARRRVQEKRPGSEMALPVSRRTKPTLEYYQQVYNIPQ